MTKGEMPSKKAHDSTKAGVSKLRETYGSVALNGRTEAISSNLDLRLSARRRRKSVCFSWDDELR